MAMKKLPTVRSCKQRAERAKDHAEPSGVLVHELFGPVTHGEYS
jgi:hypothetical protein